MVWHTHAMYALAMDKDSLKITMRERGRIGIAAINFEIHVDLLFFVYSIAPVLC
jgi:hypothetical protein